MLTNLNLYLYVRLSKISCISVLAFLPNDFTMSISENETTKSIQFLDLTLKILRRKQKKHCRFIHPYYVLSTNGICIYFFFKQHVKEEKCLESSVSCYCHSQRENLIGYRYLKKQAKKQPKKKKNIFKKNKKCF